MKFIASLIVLLVMGSGVAHAESEERSFTNENIGGVLIDVPREWKAIERHHIRFGTTFYRLVPPDKSFDVEFMVNDLEHMKMDALINKDLEIYIKSNLTSYAAESVEKKAVAHRFGSNRDGVYSRLTDDSNEKGQFLLLTQGVRLFDDGKKVVLFILESNDYDENILKKVLAIAASVRLK